MADIVTPFRHLKTYPADGPLDAADVADHQIAAGTVTEGFALRARGAATRKMVWSDDAGVDRNNPLRAVLIADSAPISNTAAVTAFNKTLTLLAGSANVQGARIRVAASGKYSSKATTPGTLGLGFRFAGVDAAFSYSDLAWNRTADGWSVWAEWIVRAIGAAATVQPAGGLVGTFPGTVGIAPDLAGVRVLSTTLAVGSVNLTIDRVISTILQFSVADPANTITMTAMSLDVALPGVVVT